MRNVMGFTLANRVPRVRRELTRDDDLFDMANLRPERTGLPFVVFVSQRGRASHGPRIKVSDLPRYDSQMAITVTLENPPRDLNGKLPPRDLDHIRDWIALNRQVIEDYWFGRIEYTEELLEQIRKI